MGTSSSDVVILFIDLAELPLVNLISSVAEELANMDGDSISVYVISDTDDHPICTIIKKDEAGLNQRVWVGLNRLDLNQFKRGRA